jgi:pimeloyl-CoA synthetase
MKLNYLVNVGGIITKPLNHEQMEQVVAQFINRGMPREAIQVYMDIELEENEYEITEVNNENN